MRTSKYLGMKSGDWTCVQVEVSTVQSVYTRKRNSEGKKIKSKRPGHRSYKYIFEKPTSDGKANKIVCLNAAQVSLVRKGKITVEEIAIRKRASISPRPSQRVTYSFHD